MPNQCRKFRKERRLTQSELADFIDVTQTTISNWELGLAKPQKDQTGRKLEVALGRPLAEIFEPENENGPDVNAGAEVSGGTTNAVSRV